MLLCRNNTSKFKKWCFISVSDWTEMFVHFLNGIFLIRQTFRGKTFLGGQDIQLVFVLMKWIVCSEHLEPSESIEVFTLSSNRYDIVVAGGVGGGPLDDSEIYNTATQEWRQGPTLPQPIYHMSSVQYEDTFLLVGGDTFSGQYSDTIYQYEQTSETWIIREERLSKEKGYMGAVLAGPPAADCSWCNKWRVNDSHLHKITERVFCFSC